MHLWVIRHLAVNTQARKSFTSNCLPASAGRPGKQLPNKLGGQGAPGKDAFQDPEES